MKAIAIVGHSKTGKTTLCETLIRTLTARGYRVGSVKEIHAEGFSIDDPASNTGRHRSAGARTVIARGPAETDVLLDHPIPHRQLLSYFDEDYVILEGVRDVPCPLIQSAASPEDLPNPLDPRTVAVSGVIANGGLREVQGLPVLNPLGDPDALADFVERTAFPPLPGVDPKACGACGCDCMAFAGKIAHGAAQREDCVQYRQPVSITVGGRELHLVPFVERIVKNAVLGLVRELDGYREHSEITVTIREDG